MGLGVNNKDLGFFIMSKLCAKPFYWSFLCHCIAVTCTFHIWFMISLYSTTAAEMDLWVRPMDLTILLLFLLIVLMYLTGA